MSATLSTLLQPAVTMRPGRYVRLLFQAWAHDIARYFSRRAALKHLGEFNDRELRDIGLSRNQIGEGLSEAAKDRAEMQKRRCR